MVIIAIAIIPAHTTLVEAAAILQFSTFEQKEKIFSKPGTGRVLCAMGMKGQLDARCT